jgi:hypothetical protein
MRIHATLLLWCLIAGLVSDAGAECIAANGRVDAAEECDGAAFGTLTCQDLCFDGGTLGCTAGCELDTGGCFVCGDGKICTCAAGNRPCEQNPNAPGCSEQCDGGNLNGATCGTASAETGGGVLACTSDCVSYDRTRCYRCGNQTWDANPALHSDAHLNQELCDGLDFGGKTCATYGFGGDADHTLLCSTTCGQIITDDCFRCGNGRVDPGEQCDAGPHNGNPKPATGPTYCDATCHGRCATLPAAERCNGFNAGACLTFCVPPTTGGGCIGSGTGCTALDSSAIPSLDRCYAAWSFDGYPSVPIVDGRVAVTCRKGDVCDATPTGPDCTFTYSACLQNPQGPGLCTPPAAGVRSVASDHGAMLTALRTALGGTIAGEMLTFSSAVTTQRCVGGIQFTVPPDGEPRTVRIDTRDASGTPRLDHDELDFVCNPRFTCDPTTGNCQ